VLAERLGMTVGQLEVRMSSRELTEWQLYDQIRGAEHDAAAQQAAKQRKKG
jgi:hypothetical protein